MTRVRFGGFASPGYPDVFVARAQLLENNGFDSAWVEDEIHVPYSPTDTVVPELFPALGILAYTTKKITIGSCVIDPGMRYPVKTAHNVATVDAASGGRLIVGIGGGEALNHEPYGVPFNLPYTRLEEHIKVLRILLAAEPSRPANYTGKVYSLKNASLKIKPTQRPYPPIYVSGFGPKTLKLAGEIGEGWLAFAHTPSSYEATLNGPVKGGAEDARRNLADLEPTLVVPVALSSDSASAAKVGAAQGKDWLALSPDNTKLVSPGVAHALGRQPYSLRATQKAYDDLKEVARQISDDDAVDVSLWGTTDSMIEQISAFVKAGVRHFIIYPVPVDSFFTGVVMDMEQWARVVREFGSKIIPHFREN